MTRLEANLLILDALKELAMKHPDMRLAQLLVMAQVLQYEPHSSGRVNLKDVYYVESTEMLERVKRNS